MEKFFFYIPIIFWGDNFRYKLTQIYIRNILSRNNIPKLSQNVNIKICFYTTPDDYEAISRSGVIAALSKYANVTFDPIQPEEQSTAQIISTCYFKTLKIAFGNGVVFYSGVDGVMSDGSLPYLYSLLSFGHCVIAGYGPRVNEESFVSQLLEATNSERQSTAPIEIGPRELTRIGIDNLHRDVLSCDVNGKNFPKKPYLLLWKSNKEDGFMVRCLNLHPYLIDCRKIQFPSELDYPIDFTLIDKLVSNLNDLYVISNSDNFCIWGLTNKDMHEFNFEPNEFRPYRVMQWMEANGYANLNFIYPYYPIIFHCKDIDSDWERLIRISRVVIDNIIVKKTTIERLLKIEFTLLLEIFILVLWKKLRALLVKKIPILKKLKTYYFNKC